MSHFYGSIPTSARKTVPTARGHRNTGLETIAACWNGCIRTYLWHDPETGKDMFEVYQSTHHGKGVRQLLAKGVVGEPVTS